MNSRLNYVNEHVWLLFDWRTCLLYVLLFTAVYLIFLPIAKWLVRIRAFRLIAYLGSGIFCILMLYFSIETFPNQFNKTDYKPLLQYFSLFGLILCILHFIQPATKKNIASSNIK